MAISLEKVELKNIRSHKDLVFSPEEEGVTAISGPNGSGKSTIVDSIAWALYGAKPQGVSKTVDIVRRGATPGKDPSWAKVYLQVNGEKLLIERRVVSKTGAVECEMYSIDEDGEEILLAGPAVSHAEPEIKRRIGLNLQGFLSAVLVQQKQVDQLIVASPKERTKVIERLTGLDSITHAYQQARDEYNSLKKLLGATPASNDLEALEQEFKNIEKEIVTVSDTLAQQQVAISKASQELLREKELLKEKHALQQEKLLLEQEVREDKVRLENIEDLVSELSNEKEAAKSKLGAISQEDLAEVADSLQEKELKLNSKRSELAILENNLKRYREKQETAQAIITQSKAPSREKTSQQLQKTSEKLKLAKKQLLDAERRATTSDATISQLNTAILVIKEGECPTCLQKVANINEAVGELEKKLASIEQEDLVSKEETVKNLESKTEALRKVLEAFEELKELQTLKEEADERSLTLTKDVKSLGVDVEILRKRYNQIARNQEERLRYNSLLEKLQKLVVQRQSISRRIEQKKSALNEIKAPSSSSLERLEKSVEELQAKVMKVEVRGSELKGKAALLEEKKDNLAILITKAEEERTRRQSLLNSIEIAENSSQLLEEFRVNRVESSIPLLESYASDFLNRFTEGKFTGIKLDAKFNAKVILNDGSDRPIGLLSGGELSAAAISLRLAISLLLNSENTGSLIILDEVLVSQDHDRAAIILSTIAEVCQGQVIIIAHNDSIDSIADKVVSLD